MTYRMSDLSIGDRVRVSLTKGGYYKGSVKGRVTKTNPTTGFVSVESAKFYPNKIRSFLLTHGNIEKINDPEVTP